MHQVFISYSTKDQVQAETVRNVLEGNDIPCWMAPRDIPGGSNYTKEIPIAIRDCQVFVLILSQHSQNSPWVLKELDSAVNHAKVILPFMLENCQLNDEFNFLLTGAQRYEAYRRKAESLEALICRIRAITGETTDSTSIPTPPAVPEPQPEQKDLYLGLARCPACGSSDLTVVQKKMGAFSTSERFLRALPFIAAFPCGFMAVCAVSIVLAFLPINSSMQGTIFTVFFLAGIATSIIGGGRMANEQIRRRRIRKGWIPEPFCCTECQKKFLVKKNR